MSFLVLRGFGTAILLARLSVPALAVAEEYPAEFPISDAQMKAVGVELVQVRKLPAAVAPHFAAQVTLLPQNQQVVSAPVAGLVNQVLVEANQTIHAGTPLLVLSSPELGQLQLALVQAANHARLAGATTRREEALFREGIIAERRVVEAKAGESDAQAEFVQARAALLLTGLTVPEVDKIASSGKVQHELRVKARMDGTVTGVEVKPGQRVALADPLVSIAQLDGLRVDVQVPSAQAAQWPPGSRLTIAGGAEAQVLSASSIIDNAQSIVLRARVTSGMASLRPGEFVQVELPIGADDAWDLPLSALVRNGEQVFVFARTEGHFVATPVTVLASAGQRVKVRGGLTADQRIAVAGVITLKAAWQGAGGMEDE